MNADDDSTTAAAAAPVTAAEKCCASCGIAAIDDIKLEPCPHCDLVEYCSDECQREDRQKHEAACKKRAAELYDEILFKQPESSCFGDCPVCFLPMPLELDLRKSVKQVCCSQKICNGCFYANQAREFKERLKEHRCPFCRHLLPETEKEYEKLHVERAKLNDPIPLHSLGFKYHKRGDYERAFHYYSKAAELGSVEAMLNLSVMYHKGEGVEEDEDKGRALMEKAAIAGHPDARYNLGVVEMENGRIDRAVKHWIIAANLGDDDSIKALKECYKDKEGNISKKAEFAAALRANQAAVGETKSPQRETAEKQIF